MSILGEIGRNIGNDAPKAALKVAEATSIGGSTVEVGESFFRSKGSKLLGSLEGLIQKKSAHIQMNGVGYMNPEFQKARYSNKYAFMKQNSSNYGTILNGSRINSFSDSSRKVSGSSSAGRLAAINKTRFV